MNFAEGTVLIIFTSRVIIILEDLRYIFVQLLQIIYFQNTGCRHQFSKYGLLTGLC